MLRASHIAVLLLIAVIVASAVMPASAHVNLLQNPGFETGSLAPYWEIDGDGEWDGGIGTSGGLENPHGGIYFAYIDTGDGGAGIWQTLNHPQCAQYLEFWYDGSVEHGELDVYYSKGMVAQDLPPTPTWTFVHVDLDTTKLTREVEVWTEDGGQFSFDDFDLEACPAAAVGGVVMPANAFALLSPWIVAVALVGCVGTTAVVAKKRHP